MISKGTQYLSAAGFGNIRVTAASMGSLDILNSFPYLTGAWLTASSKQAIIDEYGDEQGAIAIAALKAEYAQIYRTEGREAADAWGALVNASPVSYAGFVLDYTQIAWLGGGGTRYIITDYTPKGNTKIVLDAQFTLINNVGWIYGSRGSNIYALATNSATNQWIFGYNGNIGNGHMSGHTLDTDRHMFTNDKGKLYIDDWNGFNYSQVNYTCQYPMGIFKSNGSGSTTACNGAKIYGMQVYEDDVLVRQYVPAIRKSDNVAGLYEMVVGAFWTNNGSGTFDTPSTP